MSVLAGCAASIDFHFILVVKSLGGGWLRGDMMLRVAGKTVRTMALIVPI